MDEIVWGVVPEATQEAAQYFSDAFTFGILMLIVGIVSGCMIGYGLHKVWVQKCLRELTV